MVSAAGRAANELASALREVGEKIGRHRGANIGEQNTKLTLINPVLRALGWNVEDLEDVRHEFKRVPQDKPVDYALMLARTPRLFVEAKSLDENLQDRRWANQIVSYAAVAGVEWVVLTNGDEYRIYNSHAPVPVEDKLFRTVRISEDSAEAAQALALLSKDETREKALDALWRVYAVDKRVNEAVERLFTPEPDPWLVRRLTKNLDGLTQGDVKDALGRLRVTFDSVAGETTVGGSESRRESEVAQPQRRVRRPTPKAVQDVTVDTLIAAGLIRPPLALTREYKGRELTARIESDGRVACLGEMYDSVSLAAAMARHSVIGAPEGRKYPPTNGWTFWRYRDGVGELRELGYLREQWVASAAAGGGGSGE